MFNILTFILFNIDTDKESISFSDFDCVFLHDDLLGFKLVEKVLNRGEVRSDLFVDGGILGEESSDAVALPFEMVELVAERADRFHQHDVLPIARCTFLISKSRSCFN